MDKNVMNLKVLLPFRVFAEINNVIRIVAETNEGYYGFLPQRLDCVAALVPGIFMYETESNEIHYLAVDDGVIVKAGLEVLVSVTNAIEGTDLTKLRESVNNEFLQLAKDEIEIRESMAKMESFLVSKLDKFHQ
jgi:F-type H+-transporting ATPase subunit epsilon